MADHSQSEDWEEHIYGTQEDSFRSGLNGLFEQVMGLGEKSCKDQFFSQFLHTVSYLATRLAVLYSFYHKTSSDQAFTSYIC